MVKIKSLKTGMLAMACFATLSAAAEAPLWLRDVKISPDGANIAFTYQGDIWTVPVSGGRAMRLTSMPSYEANPVWSPDSRQIAFASDRNGNFDIYIVDAMGGPARRLTSNSASEIPEAFSADGKEVLYSAAIQAPTASAMYPSGRMTQLYGVDTATGTTHQILGTPAKAISVSPDGDIMLYNDVKGFEDEWRKHHTSSVTRDIWKYDTATGTHTNITNRAGEDRDPVLDAATETVYFLSERDGGTFNVYQMPLDNPAGAIRLTDFDTHPVRFLSRANNGTLAFTYDGEIYTMLGRAARGAVQPEKVNITVITDDSTRPERVKVSPDGSAKPSPDGKMVAFESRGDIFVTSVEYPTSVQVTRTPQAERHVSWGDDNRSLYYTSERTGRKAIYKAEMARKEDPNFANATEIIETLVLGDDTNEYSHPLLSPDGKKLAYVKNRNQLTVRDIATGVDTPTDKPVNPGFEDEMVFVWSPDSRWLAIEYIPEMHDPYSDIALVEVETGKVTDITNSGYFDMNPHFSHDGNAVIFFSDRYGMRNHASWGSQEDIMIAFLNREARDKFRLSKEDAELEKDAAKKDEKKEEDKADDKNKKGKKNAKDSDKKEDKGVKPIVVELADIDTRIECLTNLSGNYGDAIMSDDGETIYYLWAPNGDYDLWKMDMRELEPEQVSKAGLSSPARLLASKDGKDVFLLGRKMQKLDPKSGKLTAITSDARQNIDAAKEREAMFDYMATEEAARFYTKDMHGVDWPTMTAAYRKFLPHINNNYDFAEMLSELLGELNVSHTGGRYYPNGSASDDRTASLGLLYDMTYTGPGLKVDEVIVDGPFDRAASKMTPGAVITAVGGEKIDANADLGAIFNNIANQKTLVEFTAPDGAKYSEVVLPVSAGKINSLLYNRWVRQRAADVERWSDGRLGYVHIPQMADDAFRPMYSDLFGKYNNREGVVVDIRWNGGGRMHEDIEALLTGQKYLTQEIRGKDVCDMPSRRWNKPSIMVVAEPCYSNAHGTPWVYQHQKIGKVVGMPVPGTMTSVNWVTMQDPSMVFGIPVIGYRTAEGNYLENTQLEPDVKVANSPETIVKGEDTQLRTAVETLLRDIDAAKSKTASK